MDIAERHDKRKRKNVSKTETIGCSACPSNEGFRMASGPPFCETCIAALQKLIINGGSYVCSSISRRKDVIFYNHLKKMRKKRSICHLFYGFLTIDQKNHVLQRKGAIIQARG